MEESQQIPGLEDDIVDAIINGVGSGYMGKSERVARKVMIELLRAERADFLLLRDGEVQEWWGSVYSGIRKKIDAYREKVRIYEVKLNAYNRLTAQERKSLGIRKPTKPKAEL